MNKVIALASGGLDSTTMIHYLKNLGYKVDCLCFDYGQSHATEILYAEQVARDLGLQWNLIDLTSVGKLLAGSALTDPTVEVPNGHYEDEVMKLTVVPNRNSIMANIAAGVAISRGADTVALAVHSGDHAIYADCRPRFVRMLQKLLSAATDIDFRVLTPFLNLHKYQIVEEGARLGVPFLKTWSCYKGGKFHCGICGTCVERKEAFALAGVPDPTTYQ